MNQIFESSSSIDSLVHLPLACREGGFLELSVSCNFLGQRKGNLEQKLYSKTLVSTVIQKKSGFLFDSDSSWTRASKRNQDLLPA